MRSSRWLGTPMRRTETEAEYEAINQPAGRRVLVWVTEPTTNNPFGELAWVPERLVKELRRWGE